MSGGFFLREQRRPLGDVWVNGVQQQTLSFMAPWNQSRGSLYITQDGVVKIAPRYMLPTAPSADLLQAGRKVFSGKQDTEGFSVGALQFDTNITISRYPRAALGTDGKYIYSVVCEGRDPSEAGLTLEEFADVLKRLGIQDALNLDGGRSATLIGEGKLRNIPRSDYEASGRGTPVFGGIVFESRAAFA
jgi:exopolysaccharide biosynthesis protein